MIDIAHPAHIHYFRNFAKIMEKRGHKYLMTLRGKDIIIKLADYYDLNYKIRSGFNKESVSKFNYALTSVKNIYRISRKFKPTLFIDMGTVFAAPVAKFLGVPYIAFDDTEAAFKARLLFMPFTSSLLTPRCFEEDLGKKHIKFNGYMELFYLHDNYFKPDIKILDELGITNDKKICIIRFVAWKAFHDKGQKGFSESEMVELVREISKKAKVFISSESDLVNDDLKPYLLKIHPGKMHDLLAFSDLYIGEGATMASECAMLGTPAIYFNTIDTGYINEQKKYGLVFKYNSYKDVLEKTDQLLNKVNIKEEWEMKRKKMLNDKIDMTAFLVWFVENYPESSATIKENPDYQNKFK
jgi:predicted glycosyltransferase